MIHKNIYNYMIGPTTFNQSIMHPLDQLSSLQSYTRLFYDDRFWTPYVVQACAQHGIPCQQVSGGIPGTFPTFIVDRQVVVKFFGRLFDGAHSFAVERAIARSLAELPHIPAAPLLGEGALDPAGADWHWPYLIFNFLEGKSYGEVRQQLTQANQTRLASQLGGWVQAIHALPVPPDGPFENTWAGYAAFLSRQSEDCRARLAVWASLPDRLLSQVEDYLLPVADLINLSTRPHIIHADLTGDHLLGQVTEGRWITRGLIDFGDARIGNIFYELPALHLDFFQGDLRMLSAFLEGYSFVPPPDFPRRALSFCLLHEFDLFTSPVITTPLLQKCLTLADLAEHLWRV
jgi:Ser/Thr protein kinase RdoA (MazF antagonist)